MCTSHSGCRFPIHPSLIYALPAAERSSPFPFSLPLPLPISCARFLPAPVTRRTAGGFAGGLLSSSTRGGTVTVALLNLCIRVAEARKTWSEGVSVGMWCWDFSLESLLGAFRRSYSSIQKNNWILPISCLLQSFILVCFGSMGRS